jgi:hypothetical protein
MKLTYKVLSGSSQTVVAVVDDDDATASMKGNEEVKVTLLQTYCVCLPQDVVLWTRIAFTRVPF